MNEHDYFDGLDADLNSEPTTRSLTRSDMQMANGGEALGACPKCQGRGSVTYGYVNIRSYPCRMCQGVGKVTASRVKRVEAAKKGRETAAQNEAARRMAFQEAHKAELAFIDKASFWSEFYQSLQNQFMESGSLSEKQIAVIRAGMAKAEARKTERAATAPAVDVTAIERLFDKALSSKLKRPVFRALDDLAISKAPDTGRNAGALYVKQAGAYAGKIQGGRFHATREAGPTVLPRLLAIAADPEGQAVMYGKETGVCGCCGAELTNPVSIARGIGPICAGKWGF